MVWARNRPIGKPNIVDGDDRGGGYTYIWGNPVVVVEVFGWRTQCDPFIGYKLWGIFFRHNVVVLSYHLLETVEKRTCSLPLGLVYRGSLTSPTGAIYRLRRVSYKLCESNFDTCMQSLYWLC